MSAELAEVGEISARVINLRTGEVAAQAQPSAPATEDASRELLASARRALLEADSLPVIADLAHRGEVAKVAARKAKLSEEACLDWEEFSLDAQREAGQVLAMMDKNTGAKGLGKSPDEVQFHDGTALPPKLEELGVTKKESHRWQVVASLSDNDYEAYKNRARAKGEITRAGVIKLAKQAHAAEAPTVTPRPILGTFATIVEGLQGSGGAGKGRAVKPRERSEDNRRDPA